MAAQVNSEYPSGKMEAVNSNASEKFAKTK